MSRMQKNNNQVCCLSLSHRLIQKEEVTAVDQWEIILLLCSGRRTRHCVGMKEKLLGKLKLVDTGTSSFQVCFCRCIYNHKQSFER